MATIASTHQATFHSFGLLPYELRRQIWQLSTPPPRIVSLVSKTTSPDHPSPCAPFCLEHRRPCHERIPALLHVCAESRDVGFEIYKPFSTALFKTNFVDLRTETLLYMPCHHSTLGAANNCEHTDPYDYFWTRPTDLQTRVIPQLAIVPDEVADIMSLMLCICQIRNAVRSEKFENLVETLRAYRNLKEIIFVQIGARKYVNGLGRRNRELGIPDVCRWVRTGWNEDSRIGDHTPRAHMWGNMQWVYEFKVHLDSVVLEEEGASLLNIRCAVLTDGRISWEQEFGGNLLSKWQAGKVSGRGGSHPDGI